MRSFNLSRVTLPKVGNYPLMILLRLMEPLLMGVFSLMLNLLHGGLGLCSGNFCRVQCRVLCSIDLPLGFILRRCRLRLCMLHMRLCCSSNLRDTLVALLHNSVQALLSLTLDNLDSSGSVSSHFCVLP